MQITRIRLPHPYDLDVTLLELGHHPAQVVVRNPCHSNAERLRRAKRNSKKSQSEEDRQTFSERDDCFHVVKLIKYKKTPHTHLRQEPPTASFPATGTSDSKEPTASYSSGGGVECRACDERNGSAVVFLSSQGIGRNEGKERDERKESQSLILSSLSYHRKGCPKMQA